MASRWAQRLPDMPSPAQREWLLAAAVGATAVLFHLGLGGVGSGPAAGWLGIVLLVLMSLPLVVRRQRPDLTVGLCGAGIMAYHLLGAESPAATVVFLFALYASAAFAPSRAEGVLSLGVSLALMTVSFVIEVGVASLLTADWVLIVFTFLVAWALGDGTRVRTQLADQLRARADQLETLRRGEQEALVAAERRRVARELHDVISHTVAVVVVQAGAARRVLDNDPAAAGTALAAIEATGREAMVELRRMLGVLRDGDADGMPDVGDPDAPTPDLATLRALVDTLADAGMPVELTGDVTTPLPAGVALCVHRAVQEGLTNVLRHAREVTAVTVALVRRPGRVDVEVLDDGRPGGRGAGVGTGAGLVGLRERVALHGGVLTAGPREPGPGFRLHASVPTGGEA